AADVDLIEAELLGEPRVVERALGLALVVFGIAGLLEIALVEGRSVHDEDAARLEVGQMHLESGRVHGDERVEMITRRVHPLAAELELEARHAEEGAGGSADLRGKIRQGRDIVAGPRRFRGELLAS